MSPNSLLAKVQNVSAKKMVSWFGLDSNLVSTTF
jgi:hypothetical protein